MNPNPWDSLKLKPLSPEEMARVEELLARPIIDPPFHPGVSDCWWPKSDEEVQ